MARIVMFGFQAELQEARLQLQELTPVTLLLLEHQMDVVTRQPLVLLLILRQTLILQPLHQTDVYRCVLI